MGGSVRAALAGKAAALLALVWMFAVTVAVPGDASAQSSVRPPEAPSAGAPAVPGAPRIPDAEPFEPEPDAGALVPLGGFSDAELWNRLRRGEQFSVSIPDDKAAVLVQDAGISWEETRAAGSDLKTYGAYALGGILALLILFYLVRGRIRIDHGKSGAKIRRFTGIERFAHWTMAVSFIILALTGLNLLYGRELLIPLLGKEAYASITQTGKLLHNTVAFAFMLGIVLAFVMWVLHNIPNRTDLKWIAQGGGLLVKGKHPPAKKFNFGQKIIFWSVVVLGVSISLSGLSLMFPYELPMFAKTFAVLNMVGFELQTDLTAIQEMQYAQLWHSIIAFAFIVIIIAHIYIGSVGMEGAFDAMGSGEVDVNWAEEHHSLWVEEVRAKERAPYGSGGSAPGASSGASSPTPAE